MIKLTCAKAPCKSCPYRQDVPSGVWAVEEYNRLPAYDGSMVEQAEAGAAAVFMCHQNDGHLCAGWVGSHGANNLLALRFAGAWSASGVDEAVWTYKSPVPLFPSGRAAAAHGRRDIGHPGRAARAIIDRLVRSKARMQKS